MIHVLPVDLLSVDFSLPSSCLVWWISWWFLDAPPHQGSLIDPKAWWVFPLYLRPLIGHYPVICIFSVAMKKVIGPIRRASIYGSVSYFGLVLINNSNLNVPSLWIAYLPMFIAVYALTQWIDRRFGWFRLLKFVHYRLMQFRARLWIVCALF